MCTLYVISDIRWVEAERDGQSSFGDGAEELITRTSDGTRKQRQRDLSHARDTKANDGEALVKLVRSTGKRGRRCRFGGATQYLTRLAFRVGGGRMT